MIYGIYLPDEVLEKIYYRNAEKLLSLNDGAAPAAAAATEAPANVIKVKPTADFEVNADASRAVWSKAEWTPIPLRKPDGLAYQSRMKLLYSTTGLYVLFDGTDKKLSVTNLQDFDDLWEQDVYEVFLWTDEKHPVYFEYEISPLGAELPILIPNFDGKFLGWRPWHYEGSRKIRKATSVAGGTKEPGATVSNWTAEVFIPYELLRPLQNVPPKPGMKWRANFYRMDYDDKNKTHWSWVPVGPSFHEYQKFGTLVFE
jgi:hypothetical protein